MELDYYEIEDRGHQWMYHWLIYMIGGLRRLPGDKVHFICPTFIDQGYHGESLAIIEDKYKMLKGPVNGKYLGKHHGEPLLAADRVHKDTYLFLRELFLSRLPSPVFNKSKYIYITRKNCHILNSGKRGIATRQILNEEDILPGLRSIGFEILQFEDYSFRKKVEYFQTSKLIISPNSGSLTYSLFADKSSTIIEIQPANTTQMDHYKIICNSLDIPYQRFSDVTVVNGPPTLGNTGWNMIINAETFFKWLRNYYLLNNI
jgi:hypothetical protein